MAGQWTLNPQLLDAKLFLYTKEQHSIDTDAQVLFIDRIKPWVEYYNKFEVDSILKSIVEFQLNTVECNGFFGSEECNHLRDVTGRRKHF